MCVIVSRREACSPRVHSDSEVARVRHSCHSNRCSKQNRSLPDAGSGNGDVRCYTAKRFDYLAE